MPPENIGRLCNHLLIVPVTLRLSFCFGVTASKNSCFEQLLR